MRKYKDIADELGIAEYDVQQAMQAAERGFFGGWFIVSDKAMGYASSSYREEHAFARGDTREQAVMAALRGGWRADRNVW